MIHAFHHLRVWLALVLPIVALNACADTLSPRDLAYARYEAECSQAQREAGRIAAYGVVDGQIDPAQLDCVILYFEATETPMTDKERKRWSRTVTEPVDATGAFNRELMQFYYLRWRLTGEGWEAMRALAPQLKQTEIDAALTLFLFPDELKPEIIRDACMRIHPDTPGFELIALGEGARDPADCPFETVEAFFAENAPIADNQNEAE